MRMMNMRKISIIILGLTLFMAATGCKKKVAAATAPPPPKQETGSAATARQAGDLVVCGRAVHDPARPIVDVALGSVGNATDISINQGVGAVQARGTRQVTPTDTTTYTLSAKGREGRIRAL